MYGIPQSEILAHKLLEQCLNDKLYRQSSLHHSYCKKNWRPIYFTLFVEHFGVKYVGTEHANNLVTTLSEHYIISQDCEGITLD